MTRMVMGIVRIIPTGKVAVVGVGVSAVAALSVKHDGDATVLGGIVFPQESAPSGCEQSSERPVDPFMSWRLNASLSLNFGFYF